MPFVPTAPPNFADADEAAAWFYAELQRLSKEMSETTAVDLRPIYAEPLRPREGMLVFADGTEWNPGAGVGTYEYSGGAWVKL